MPSNHLILFRPLFLLSSLFPRIRVFSNEPALCIRWPKYWSLSFNISPSNEHSGLISFRVDWLDVLAVQGTLKSFLQHHSANSSILWHSPFFIVPTLTSIDDYWKNHSKSIFTCTLSRWCHPTILSSVVPFSSCPQSFPALGSFPMSQLFASGGQSIGVSASTSVLPVNTQDWSPLGWTGWLYFGGLQNHCRWWLQPWN